MPFSRDLSVSPASLSSLAAAAALCGRVGGAVLLAPESRLSLHLKGLELRSAGRADEADRLAAFEALPWHDVHDESDELMRAKLQLVYAIGDPAGLPSLNARSAAAHALLLALQHDVSAAAAFRAAGVGVVEARPDGQPPGAWYLSARLVAPHDAPGLRRLEKALARAVVRSPPYNFAWMSRFSAPGETAAAAEASLVDYMIDSSRDADAILPRSSFRDPSHREGLLALRGLLACGVLPHCLRQRHRVGFGLGGGSKSATSLAVPYRVSNEPAERSEFQHADAALVLTTLAYFQTGLSGAQVAQAFESLLRLGATAQGVLYAQWLALSRPALTDDEARSVDGVRKLDVENPAQAALLVRAFGHNPHTSALRCSREHFVFFLHARLTHALAVRFWLCEWSLPRDTSQFPSRLRATAWHLAPPPRGRCAGFSGTKGALLSLQLDTRQCLVRRSDCAPADGRQPLAFAAARHAARAAQRRARGDGRGSDGAAAQAVVRSPAVRRGRRRAPLARAADLRGCDEARHRACGRGRAARGRGAGRGRRVCTGALGSTEIFCGVLLLTLLSFRDAQGILPADGHLHGVVFFDRRAGRGGGWVAVAQGGGRLPLRLSPLKARDAFVIFDEPRCRGADMKLGAGEAVLTLGPKCGKDKLCQARARVLLRFTCARVLTSRLQAAMRLRQLGVSQRLLLTSEADTHDEIVDLKRSRCGRLRKGERMDALDVLFWVLSNTAAATRAGLLEMATNGLHYYDTLGEPHRAAMPETHSLEVYAPAASTAPVAEVVSAAADRLFGPRRAPPKPDVARSVASLVSRVARHGATLRVPTSPLDEECERELEQQKEQEAEEEAEAPACEARAEEADWATPAVVATHASAAAAAPGAMRLSDFVTTHLPPALRSIDWGGSGEADIWMSRNFAVPIQAASADLSAYLRPVDALLVFPRDGVVWLLTAREADSLLSAAWAQHVAGRAAPDAASPDALLTHLCVAGGGASRMGLLPLRVCGGWYTAAPVTLRPAVLARLQLFSGAVMFGGDDKCRALGNILAPGGAEARAAALALPHMRGRGALLMLSQLEALCEAEGHLRRTV